LSDPNITAKSLYSPVLRSYRLYFLHTYIQLLRDRHLTYPIKTYGQHPLVELHQEITSDEDRRMKFQYLLSIRKAGLIIYQKIP